MNENVPCIEFITPCKVHESLFIGYCWNKPLIYKRMADQKITRDTFTLEIWWFYYNLGKIMFESGIRVFDDKTVYSFLISNPEIERGMSATKQYNDYGGYITIEQLIKECKNDEQNPVHIYKGAGNYTVNLTATNDGGTNTRLRFPTAFRSLLRPSSAPGAKAFPLRSL